MGGPINRQFSTLAAMTVDGMVGWDITELARSSTATNMPKAMDTMGFLHSFCIVVFAAALRGDDRAAHEHEGSRPQTWSGARGSQQVLTSE